MGMATGNCPYCGQPYRCREDSDGMIKRCEACGKKFRLEIVYTRGGVPVGGRPRPGCLKAVAGLFVLLIVIAFIVNVIAGGKSTGELTPPSSPPAVVHKPIAPPAPQPIGTPAAATTQRTIDLVELQRAETALSAAQKDFHDAADAVTAANLAAKSPTDPAIKSAEQKRSEMYRALIAAEKAKDAAERGK